MYFWITRSWCVQYIQYIRNIFNKSLPPPSFALVPSCLEQVCRKFSCWHNGKVWCPHALWLLRTCRQLWWNTWREVVDRFQSCLTSLHYTDLDDSTTDEWSGRVTALQLLSPGQTQWRKSRQKVVIWRLSIHPLSDFHFSVYLPDVWDTPLPPPASSMYGMNLFFQSTRCLSGCSYTQLPFNCMG